MRLVPELRLFGALVASVAMVAIATGTGTAAPARAAKLTPAEQKWVKPLLTVWEAQNAGLNLVLAQAAKPNAFTLGSKPNNAKLATILGALLSCKKPKDAIKVAGTPPTARLQPFVTALGAACVADESGANAFLKAMVTERARQAQITAALIKQGVADFKLGSTQVRKAYTSITSIGAHL